MLKPRALGWMTIYLTACFDHAHAARIRGGTIQLRERSCFYCSVIRRFDGVNPPPGLSRWVND